MKRLAYLVTPLAIAACATTGDRDSTTDEDYDDVASSIASASRPQHGELGAMMHISVLARGGFVPGLSSSGDGSYRGELLGFVYQYDLTCRDAGDVVQVRCDENTDRADASVTFAGTLALPRLTLSLDHSGDWTVNGLTTTVAQFDGNGATSFDSRVEHSTGAISTYALDSSSDVDAVRVARFNAFPTGGTIRYSLDAVRTRDGEDTHRFSVDATITFEGNGHAMIVLDGSHTYDLDLATGIVIRIR